MLMQTSEMLLVKEFRQGYIRIFHTIPIIFLKPKFHLVAVVLFCFVFNSFNTGCCYVAQTCSAASISASPALPSTGVHRNTQFHGRHSMQHWALTLRLCAYQSGTMPLSSLPSSEGDMDKAFALSYATSPFYFILYIVETDSCYTDLWQPT